MKKVFFFLSMFAASCMMLPSDVYSQTFTSIRHHVSASFLGNDPYGDDFPTGSESLTSRAFEAFYGNFQIGSGGAQAECSLSSDLDRSTGVFYAYGHSASGLYVQGTATAQSQSSFQSDFRLDRPGQVTLSGVIGVSQFLGSYQAHDVPGTAQVILRIRNLNTNRNVVNKVVKMNGYIDSPLGLDQLSLDDLSPVELPAGRYRLLIDASSNDDAIQEEVAGSIAVAFFEVEGTIVDE